MGMIVKIQGRWAKGLRQAALAALLLSATGCGGVERFYASKLPLDTPIDWWHQLQGGTIAEERPPPPGVTEPYPNLGQIPPKPVPTDAATRAGLSARLASERNRMERAAERDPILAPAPAAPRTAAAAAPAVPDEPPPMARIEAASAAPLPRAAPAPVAAPAPAAIQQAASDKPLRPGAVQPPGEPIVSGPVPALPTAPPPLPSLPGIPVAAAAAAGPRVGPQAMVEFLPGSAVLRPESDAALHALADQRFGGQVAVLGGGDAGSAAPDVQAAALPLAWRRARAIAAVLTTAGVPASAMRVDAAALGRGGIARLVD